MHRCVGPGHTPATSKVGDLSRSATTFSAPRSPLPLVAAASFKQSNLYRFGRDCAIFIANLPNPIAKEGHIYTLMWIVILSIRLNGERVEMYMYMVFAPSLIRTKGVVSRVQRVSKCTYVLYIPYFQHTKPSDWRLRIEFVSTPNNREGKKG